MVQPDMSVELLIFSCDTVDALDGPVGLQKTKHNPAQAMKGKKRTLLISITPPLRIVVLFGL